MISDSGETSSERGGTLQQQAAASGTNRSPNIIVHEDDVDIFNAKNDINISGRFGRSPRLQGQTGALLNKVDPLFLGGGSKRQQPTALNIMRRSCGGRSDIDTSGSGRDSSVPPRAVGTESVSPSPYVKSKTPVISNVIRDHPVDYHRNYDIMPPNKLDYHPSHIPMPPPAVSGYNFQFDAHDIHRAQWDQEQRELAADYYPSASNNYTFDYYANSPGRYYQQHHPTPASLRYHQQMTDSALELLQMEQLVRQKRLFPQQGGGALDSKLHGKSTSPSLPSPIRNQVQEQPPLRTIQQQQSSRYYEERDWRTNQVWREDDHSHIAKMTTPISTERRPSNRQSDRENSDSPSLTFPFPRLQHQPNQSTSVTIDQYDITDAGQMYGQQQHQQLQLQPQFVQGHLQPPQYDHKTPSPPPAPLHPSSAPMIAGIDPRIQHQINLMAMMFPPQISPIHPHLGRGGLVYPPQYYPPYHNFYQGGVAGQPPMPQEVVIPTPSASGLDPAAIPAGSVVPPPYQPPDSADAASAPMPRNGTSLDKRVSFGHLQIRTYETILGDNPSCTGGPSLSIGWRYNPEHFHSTVDEYERTQDTRYGGFGIRPRDLDLVLLRPERETILLHTGYTQQDLAEAVRRLNKAKNQRRQTVHNLSSTVMFFEEKAESCKRSLERLFFNRKRTRHMYDDWKKFVSAHGGNEAPRRSILRRRNSV